MPYRSAPAKRRPSACLAFLTLPALLLVTAFACTPADSSEASPAASLEERVTAELDALNASSTLYAKHLPSGREISIRADRPMNTLSVIKIPIMVQAFKDHESGRLDMATRYPVEPENMRRGSGLIQTFAPGLNPTLKGLVTQMIITSDNTATDMVIDAVGMGRVNALLSSQGYQETALKHTTGRLFLETWLRTDSANASLSPRQVFERGFPSDEGAPERFFEIEGDSTIWLGRTTAREMGRLLEQILDEELASPESSAEMIGILKAQFYTTRLPRRVRFQGVEVAHKTGDWPPYAGNDVGILFYEGGPTIISVFTNQSRGDFFELEASLGRIAEEIVGEWR